MTLTIRLHDRRRREELAVVVRLLDGELGEEVFVDAAEDVARGVFDLLTVEVPHQVFEHLGLEDAEVLGQHVRERLKLGLDRGHRVGDETRQVGSAHGGLLHDPVVAGFLRQPERTAAQVVGGLDLALRHLAGGLVFLNLPGRCLEAVGSVAQEDHAQDGHEVVAGGQLGVGAEVVGGLPEVGFELFYAFESVDTHAV